jgi:hypothetical protein
LGYLGVLQGSRLGPSGSDYRLLLDRDCELAAEGVASF